MHQVAGAAAQDGHQVGSWRCSCDRSMSAEQAAVAVPATAPVERHQTGSTAPGRPGSGGPGSSSTASHMGPDIRSIVAVGVRNTSWWRELRKDLTPCSRHQPVVTAEEYCRAREWAALRR